MSTTPVSVFGILFVPSEPLRSKLLWTQRRSRSDAFGETLPGAAQKSCGEHDLDERYLGCKGCESAPWERRPARYHREAVVLAWNGKSVLLGGILPVREVLDAACRQAFFEDGAVELYQTGSTFTCHEAPPGLSTEELFFDWSSGHRAARDLKGRLIFVDAQGRTMS